MALASLSSEAAQTLVLFLLALLLALLLVLPGISPRLLETVLVAVAIVSGTILLIIGRGHENVTGDGAEDRLARLLDRVSPNLVTMLLLTVAGCLQLAGVNGLYWLAAAEVLALFGGVINAWLFLTR
jgi:hypothetical protein